MVPIKRRSFLKSIAAVVVGGTAARKAKKIEDTMPVIRIASEAPVNPKITIGKSANDICNEALEKIGDSRIRRRSGTTFIAEIPKGEYKSVCLVGLTFTKDKPPVLYLNGKKIEGCLTSKVLNGV